MGFDSWWLRGLAGLAAGIALGWSSGGCGLSETFVCQTDDQCGGGSCADGFCAFPDGECESGQRYGALAGSVAGDCVPVVGDTDGSTDDGTSSGGTSTAGSSSSTAGTSGTTTDTATDVSTSMVGPSDGTDSTSDSVGSDGSTGEPGTSTTGRVPVERIDEGLIVYYRPVDIDSGDTVPDISGVAPALDMSLQGDGFTWEADGLHTAGIGTVLAQGAPSKIRTACQATNELTVEAWITPDVAGQFGPARIVTYSFETAARNFTLGQGTFDDEMGWVARVRTTDTDINGIPQLEELTAVQLQQTHLVFTRRAGESTLYVDGEQVAQQTLGGSLSDWSSSSNFAFAWGNEIGAVRPWRGTFHLVAVYDVALSDDEVEQNFAAGL